MCGVEWGKYLFIHERVGCRFMLITLGKMRPIVKSLTRPLIAGAFGMTIMRSMLGQQTGTKVRLAP
jgi:hypothetical protein